jgi:hypothetical protein
MSKLERLVGNVMTIILIGIFVFSILYTVFSLLFRDGRGISLYGGRGEMYMAE